MAHFFWPLHWNRRRERNGCSKQAFGRIWAEWIPPSTKRRATNRGTIHDHHQSSVVSSQLSSNNLSMTNTPILSYCRDVPFMTHPRNYIHLSISRFHLILMPMAFYMCPLRTRQLTKSNALPSEAQEDSGETTECWSDLCITQILPRMPRTRNITFNEKSYSNAH